jgi:hypothetical protein
MQVSTCSQLIGALTTWMVDFGEEFRGWRSPVCRK